MNTKQNENRVANIYLLLTAFSILTAVFYIFSSGISGNDFWWHTKAGEWMVNNRSLPGIDPFSWYAQEKNLVWASHEWLAQILIHLVHRAGGSPGIFIFSLSAAWLMILLIIARNRISINRNLVFGTIFLSASIPLFAGFFCGRPQTFSYFLLFATLHCLYDLKNNENSKIVLLTPFFAILWANLHAGSSSLSYILCFTFFFSGLADFSWGRLKAEKHTPRQTRIYLITGLLTIAGLTVNPYGLEMVLHPYVNINDHFLQMMINEWNPPDAKIIIQVLFFFFPMFLAAIAIMLSEKPIKLIDLLLFVLFSYMFFRSRRFSILLMLAASFFVFDYPPEKQPEQFSQNRKPLPLFPGIVFTCILLLTINLLNITKTLKTFQRGELVSVALDSEFIDFIKTRAPKRLFNDFNYGETLIYRDIKTFADARADLFSPHNLRDMLSLLKLTQTDGSQREKSLDPQKLIEKYDFDAFLLRTGWSLANYLRSRPDEYRILKETEETVYFERVTETSSDKPAGAVN